MTWVNHYTQAWPVAGVLGGWYSQLAFVPFDALGGAEALARVGIAQ